MKQLLQNMRNGQREVVDVPSPRLEHGRVLVRVEASLVSAGTERMVVEFANKGILAKAKSRPDLVRETLLKARREGLVATIEAVRRRLDQPMALGYSCAGTVLATASDISDVRPGDRVACGGGGYAVHAEAVAVPRNLIATLPPQVDSESAAFVTLGSIALHGLRLTEARLGEVVAVIGLGLVGLLTVQLANSAGCLVVGMDPDAERCRLARDMGCVATTTEEEMQVLVSRQSSGIGADAVIIAAATTSNAPLRLVGVLARDRARVVAVGAVGMEIPRKAFFEKELNFQLSRSYGPGRYDTEYEEKGHVYPPGYVRWTENANMKAFVQMLADRRIDVGTLISHRFPIEEASAVYDLISGKNGKPFLGVLFTYDREPDLARRIVLSPTESAAPLRQGELALGLLGAGNFATATLLPALKRVSGVRLVGVCASSGSSSRHAGERFGFRYCTSDERDILDDSGINTVAIATRHNLHARQVMDALKAGKHVFCEKPLCLNEGELREILEVCQGHKTSYLMVGFNRRFAPLAQKLKSFLTSISEPLALHYRVNAGRLPFDHWLHDDQTGGGRIIGEACHFIDFLIFLTGALPVQVFARSLPDGGRYHGDNVSVIIDFADGSVGSVSYLACGDRSLSKERIEVFGGGAAAILDDFRRLDLLRQGRRTSHKSRLRQDKGHRGEWEALCAAVRTGGPPPLSLRETVATTLATFRVLDSLRLGRPVAVQTEAFVFD